MSAVQALPDELVAAAERALLEAAGRTDPMARRREVSRLRYAADPQS